MPNRKKWIRYVLYAVEILLLFLLQDTPGLLPQIMGVKPLPVLSAALTIAACVLTPNVITVTVVATTAIDTHLLY